MCCITFAACTDAQYAASSSWLTPARRRAIVNVLIGLLMGAKLATPSTRAAVCGAVLYAFAMSRRDQIRMTPAEIDAYLAEPHLCRIGTFGPGGTVHMVAMNYGFVDGTPAFWTYGKAQKVKNLERNHSIGMLVDTGTLYHELRGVHLMGTGEIADDPASVNALWESMRERYRIKGDNAAGASAPKRMVVKVHADKVLSWDHNKLAGAY